MGLKNEMSSLHNLAFFFIRKTFINSNLKIRSRIFLKHFFPEVFGASYRL